MSKCAYVALNAAARASIDHGCRAYGLHTPTEKAGEKVRSLGAVTAADFKVNYRLSHRNLLARNGRDNNTSVCGLNIKK
jgi:hypothetical protein